MTAMKVAIYARVSTEEQAKAGTSIDTQIDELRSYCKRMGFQIFDEYVDGGFTGSVTDRPALNKLREAAKSKEFDCVLVYKVDRGFRESVSALTLVLKEFEELGVGFFFSIFVSP